MKLTSFQRISRHRFTVTLWLLGFSRVSRMSRVSVRMRVMFSDRVRLGFPNVELSGIFIFIIISFIINYLFI